jgi:hypothetical protein
MKYKKKILIENEKKIKYKNLENNLIIKKKKPFFYIRFWKKKNDKIFQASTSNKLPSSFSYYFSKANSLISSEKKTILRILAIDICCKAFLLFHMITKAY